MGKESSEVKSDFSVVCVFIYVHARAELFAHVCVCEGERCNLCTYRVSV